MGNIISVHANAETAAANNACLPDANEDRSVVNMSTSSKKRCIILKTSVHPGQQVCIVLTAKHIDTITNQWINIVSKWLKGASDANTQPRTLPLS